MKKKQAKKLKSALGVILKKKEKKPTHNGKARVTQMEMINYILATMKFKTKTIIMVRNFAKRLQDKRRLTNKQSGILKDVYTEWVAGRPKVVKKKNKPVRVLKKKGRKK